MVHKFDFLVNQDVGLVNQDVGLEYVLVSCVLGDSYYMY